MRHTLLALLLLLGAISHSFAQTYRYYLHIPDNSIISSVANALPASITPVFNDPGINTIIARYEITEWKKAFPTSSYESSRCIYQIACDSPTLPAELHAYDSTLFPSYTELPVVQSTSTYTPNDSGLHYDAYLEFIRARQAWFITKGNPNILLGVSDTWFDLNHPDMGGKFYNVWNINPSHPDSNHGVHVAGLVAGATDNWIGFPSIGFNCKLSVTTDRSAAALLSLSQAYSSTTQPAIKAINASWFSYATDTLERSKNFDEQGIYNEIYENGTLPIFGAGNGPQNGIQPWQFTYPATLDHNFAVSNVGWEHDSTAGNSNVKWMHEINKNDTVTCYQHNAAMDLLAPSVRIGGHNFFTGAPTVHYTEDGGWGTSFGAPLVTGTCGLMLSVIPWLTPYQMEWVLKETSRDVRAVSWNKKYINTSSPTRHRGTRIGSGALDAGAAVAEVRKDTFNVYAPYLTTFTIEGIDLNTKCRPNIFNPSRPLPRLKPILKNGTPPYTYLWEPYSDNNAKLHQLDPLDSPRVVSSDKAHLLHYRLTVFDNSPIQKVANKEVRIQLLTDTTAWDIAMQDAYADMLNERNTMDVVNAKDWNIWESPDIWCRQQSDSLTTHQNPEYQHPDPNYIYTRIKNVGCVASPQQDSTMLNLYWTVASTGETWNIDWKGTAPPLPPNNMPAGGTIVNQQGLPSIPPGGQILVETPWAYPPRPQDYDSTLTQLPVCLLARLTHLGAANDGMTFVEDSVTKENVWNNNNIVTRNLVVTNLNAISPYNTPVWTGNSSNTPGTFTLQVITGQQIKPFIHGNPGSFLLGTLQLGDLYDIWVAGGRQGNVSNYEDDTKTVQFDLSEPLRLGNLVYDGNEKHMIFLKLEWNGNPVPQGVTDDRIFIRQLIEHIDSVDNGDGTKFAMARDEIYGTVAFALNIEPTEEIEGKPSTHAFDEVPAMFTGYPNPSHENYTLLALGDETSLASIVIVDIAGRTVYSKKNVSFEDNKYKIRTSALQPGIYFIKMIDKQGKQYSLKFMKAE